MILGDAIMLGGSGGETASIFVTGLTSADQVVATKGSKSWNGVWGTYIIEGVSKQCHKISHLNEYGTYTVTATDGTQTATQNVLVDVATEYEIAMSYHTIPQGTSAYFKFTTDYTDIVGGNVGTSLTGSPTITSGGVYGDNCLYLNGSSSLTIPYSDSLNLDTNCTVEFWLKAISTTTQDCFVWGNPIRSGTFNKGYGLYLRSDNANFKIAYGNGSSETTNEICARSLVLDSTWHHISLNKNGTTYTFYVDGELVNTLTLSISNGTTDFLLGKSRDRTAYVTMYMNDLLIVRGRTLRTSDFDVPTRHYV